MPKAAADKILRAVVAAALAFVFAAALVQSAEAQEQKTKIEFLLETELHPFWVDENGWTQMHWAAAADDSESALRLLEIGATPNITDNSNESDFSDKGKQRFKLLGQEKDNWKNNGYTPLLVALGFGSHMVASILIANSAEVNAKNKSGWTPLHIAAINNASENAKMLIEYGAKINAINKEIKTPLHLAAFGNALKIAKILIEHGAKVNARDKNSGTPLHSAAFGNAPEMVKLLIERDAKINAMNDFDWMPLHSAALGNAPGAAKILIEHSAKINAKDNNGNTPTDLAIKQSIWAIVKNSVEKNAEMQSLLKQHGGRCNKQC